MRDGLFINGMMWLIFFRRNHYTQVRKKTILEYYLSLTRPKITPYMVHTAAEFVTLNRLIQVCAKVAPELQRPHFRAQVESVHLGSVNSDD